MSASRACLPILACLLLGSLPGALFANPFELFGASPASSALGSAVTARVQDYGALWHNPAGLGLSGLHTSIGLGFAFDDVQVRLKPRPAGYDLPDVGSGSAAIPSKYRLQSRTDTQDLPNLYGFRLGAVGSFGLEKLRLGVAVQLPMDRIGLQQSRFSDEREQYGSNRLDFELLGRRSQHQVVLLGAGYPVLDWLSLGAGFSVLPAGKAKTSVYLADATRQEQVVVSVDNEQLGRTAPHFGLVAHGKQWRAGAAWRSASFFGLDIDNTIQIKGFQGSAQSFPVRQQVRLLLNYSPDTLAIGGAGWLGRSSLSVDAVLSRWSDYVDTQGEKAGFSDTWSVRAGLEHHVEADRYLRAGLQWEPSPVPAQTGRTSYVDNDRLVATAGASHAIDLLGRKLELDWYLQLHHLLARDTNKRRAGTAPACAPGVTVVCDEIPDDTKDPATGATVAEYAGLQTGSPGFPGWTSWGELLAFGLDLRWRF